MGMEQEVDALMSELRLYRMLMGKAFSKMLCSHTAADFVSSF